MADQAAKLRELAKRVMIEKELQSATNVRRGLLAETIAITGGKGGVGKTFFAVNLSVALSKVGKKVVLFDADIGLSNVEIVLGLVPKFRLDDVIRGERQLHEVILPGPSGVMIVPGATDIVNISEGSVLEDVLIPKMAVLDNYADYIIFDTSAGISDNVIKFVIAAGKAILVVSPEPTSVYDAYALIKAVLARRRDVELYVVVNMARSRREANKIADVLRSTVGKFLRFEIEVLGYVPWDESASESIKAQRPLVEWMPWAKASSAIISIAEKISGFKVKHRGLLGFINSLLREKVTGGE